MKKLEEQKLTKVEALLFDSFCFEFPEGIETYKFAMDYYKHWADTKHPLALIPPVELVRYLRSFGLDAKLNDIAKIMRGKSYFVKYFTTENKDLNGYLALIKSSLAESFIKKEFILGVEPFEALKRHFLFLKARKNSEAHFLLERHYGKYKLLGHLDGKELAKFLNKIYPNIPEVKAREIQKALSGNKFRRRRARMKPRDEEFKLGYYVIPMSREAAKFIKNSNSIVKAYY